MGHVTQLLLELANPLRLSAHSAVAGKDLRRGFRGSCSFQYPSRLRAMPRWVATSLNTCLPRSPGELHHS